MACASIAPALPPHFLADGAGNPLRSRLRGNDARLRRAPGDLEHQLGAGRLLELIALADRDDERGTVPACNGGCCTSGCSCCVPMTLAEPEAGWPLLANALDIIAPAPSTHAGIEPEAPAKPPKSIT